MKCWFFVVLWKWRRDEINSSAKLLLFLGRMIYWNKSFRQFSRYSGSSRWVCEERQNEGGRERVFWRIWIGDNFCRIQTFNKCSAFFKTSKSFNCRIFQLSAISNWLLSFDNEKVKRQLSFLDKLKEHKFSISADLRILKQKTIWSKNDNDFQFGIYFCLRS